MKTGILRKGISMMAVAAMTMALLTGCGERANVPVNPFTKERDILDFDAIYTMNETSGSGTLATYAGNLFTPAKREALYNSKNGWSVKYDPEMFMLYEDGPVVNFVYMGESAGTNMITVTYTTEKNAQKAINEIGKAALLSLYSSIKSLIVGREKRFFLLSYISSVVSFSFSFSTALFTSFSSCPVSNIFFCMILCMIVRVIGIINISE